MARYAVYDDNFTIINFINAETSSNNSVLAEDINVEFGDTITITEVDIDGFIKDKKIQFWHNGVEILSTQQQAIQARKTIVQLDNYVVDTEYNKILSTYNLA